MTNDNGFSQEVLATPCGTDCTHLRYPAPGNGPGFDMHLHGNQWVADTSLKFVIDKDSLQGTHDTPVGAMPFRLTKNG